MNRFDNQVVIVTGAASGIGAAIARRMASEGAKLVLADLSEPRLLEMVDSLGAGGRVRTIVADMSQQAQVEAMVELAVEAFGQLDVLVNNAGRGSFGRITQLDPAQWREVFAVDVDSVFYGCRAAIPHLIKTGGNVVNIGSISGIAGDYGNNAYNAAKAAVINLTRSLAIDHAADGVRVNCVSPGLVATPLINQTPQAALDAWNGVIPMGRPGKPEEIAAAVAFVASRDASYMTGHNLVVDGGTTAHTGQPNLLKMFGM